MKDCPQCLKRNVNSASNCRHCGKRLNEEQRGRNLNDNNLKYIPVAGIILGIMSLPPLIFTVIRGGPLDDPAGSILCCLSPILAVLSFVAGVKGVFDSIKGVEVSRWKVIAGLYIGIQAIVAYAIVIMVWAFFCSLTRIWCPYQIF